jgi:hypothetical protein
VHRRRKFGITLGLAGAALRHHHFVEDVVPRRSRNARMPLPLSNSHPIGASTLARMRHTIALQAQQPPSNGFGAHLPCARHSAAHIVP